MERREQREEMEEATGTGSRGRSEATNRRGPRSKRTDAQDRWAVQQVDGGMMDRRTGGQETDG